MLDSIPENCAEPPAVPLATCRFSDKRKNLEKECDKVRLDLVASPFDLHKLEEGIARLGKSVGSFLMM